MSQVVITRGPLDGQKLSKTITDAGKIEKLLARAEAMPAPTSSKKVGSSPFPLFSFILCSC
jgi:hypothetical protein